MLKPLPNPGYSTYNCRGTKVDAQVYEQANRTARGPSTDSYPKRSYWDVADALGLSRQLLHFLGGNPVAARRLRNLDNEDGFVRKSALDGVELIPVEGAVDHTSTLAFAGGR